MRMALPDIAIEFFPVNDVVAGSKNLDFQRPPKLLIYWLRFFRIFFTALGLVIA